VLAAAAGLYAVGTIALAIALRAEPARARACARLAGIVKAGPYLVGLACLGFVIDAIDFRPGHEADVLARWPALLPQVAALSAGAGFVTGLLAAARPLRVALAAGGLMAALALLIWAVAAWFLVALWREDATVISDLRRSAPVSFALFFKYVLLFPIVTIAASAGGASLGRLLHSLLGLSANADEAGGTPAARQAELAATAEPASLVAPPSGPASLSPEALAPDDVRAGRIPPLAMPRPRVTTARWPGLLLVAIGVLLMLPAGCDLLTPKAGLVASNPVGGAMLADAPSEVALTYSGGLSSSSSVRVRRTVTLDAQGREEATGGTPVAESFGSSALSADRRVLRIRLPDGLPGGLYLVEWTAVDVRSGNARHGDLYFGVRMKVPRFIRDGGASRESDPYERDRREMLGGGVLAVLLGLASRWYANALQGR
jgi:methionine-rich copper-binding protein CopC